MESNLDVSLGIVSDGRNKVLCGKLFGGSRIDLDREKNRFLLKERVDFEKRSGSCFKDKFGLEENVFNLKKKKSIFRSRSRIILLDDKLFRRIRKRWLRFYFRGRGKKRKFKLRFSFKELFYRRKFRLRLYLRIKLFKKRFKLRLCFRGRNYKRYVLKFRLRFYLDSKLRFRLLRWKRLYFRLRRRFFVFRNFGRFLFYRWKRSGDRFR